MTTNDSTARNAGLQKAIDLFHAGQLNLALSVTRKLSKAQPDSPKVWAYLGLLNHELGRYRAAAESFRNVTRLSPHSEKASLGLFVALWKLGKRQAALKEMGRFLARGDSKGYLNMLTSGQRRSAGLSALRSSEVRHVEDIYQKVERHWDETVMEIDDATELSKLVHA